MNKLTEAAKVTCRNARRDVLDEFKKMKKDSEITEDDMARLEKDVQKYLDDAVATIDKYSATKEKEIMEEKENKSLGRKILDILGYIFMGLSILVMVFTISLL